MDKKVVILILIIGILLAGLFYFQKNKEEQLPKKENPSLMEVRKVPISEAKKRVTKKPFGIYVAPQNSPVTPERFTGYHTGTDFEVTKEELNRLVSVGAICEGVISSRMVSGYGGVILQNCSLGGQRVTILYGHVDLNTKTSKNLIKKGDFLANLGAENSTMSGGERKHLHLGIIKGEAVDLRGYVQSKNELLGWLNPLDFLE